MYDPLRPNPQPAQMQALGNVPGAPPPVNAIDPRLLQYRDMRAELQQQDGRVPQGAQYWPQPQGPGPLQGVLDRIPGVNTQLPQFGQRRAFNQPPNALAPINQITPVPQVAPPQHAQPVSQQPLYPQYGKLWG